MRYLVVFGGASYEHEISIVSAVVLKRVLKADLGFIFVSGEGEFYLIAPEELRAGFFSSLKYKKSPKLLLKNGGFYTTGGLLGGAKKIECDCVINLIHGADGEDGKLAALFDFYSVAYMGPGLEASVMSYNKLFTKFLADFAGVKTLPYQALKRGEALDLPLPVILKPARLGSSIGVAAVGEMGELDYALDVAYEFDDMVLAEPFLSGIREFNLAGFRLKNGLKNGADGRQNAISDSAKNAASDAILDDFEFSIVEEPNKEELLDFEQKYLRFGNDSGVAEAKITDEVKMALKRAFAAIYDAGGFDGALIRCDFFYKDGEIYLNEINPNPGSLANYLFEDFTASIARLAATIKPRPKIAVNYNFIQKITKNKGGKIG